MNTLAKRMIRARELRGWSQAKLAAEVPCSQSTIGNIESGYRKSMRNIVAAARALNVSPDWLEDGRGPGPDAAVVAEDPGHDLPTIRPELDPYTAEVIRIMATLDSAHKQAALARLREFVSYLDPHPATARLYKWPVKKREPCKPIKTTLHAKHNKRSLETLCQFKPGVGDG